MSCTALQEANSYAGAHDHQGHIDALPDVAADCRQADRRAPDRRIRQPDAHRTQHLLRALGAVWERALDSLSASLANLPDCRIPVEMLQVAVRYTKTGDKRHLLSLPLEQRRLLEGVLPPTAGERADRA